MKKQNYIFILMLMFALTLPAQKKPIEYGNNPDAGKYANINGIQLYYEVYGKGQPLLMLHGNGGSMAAFKNQISYFEKKFLVIAVDSRLQGKSGGNPDSLSYDMMANDFAALLDELKIDSAYVLGWSDGGIDGIILAMKFPQKVKKLAVSGANTIADTTALYPEDLKEMKNSLEKKAITKREKTLLSMMLNQPDIAYSELKKIKCPVLVMAGDKDMIRAEHTVRIFQSLPFASLCIFPDSYHHVLIQHPALFNETVMNFFCKEQIKN